MVCRKGLVGEWSQNHRRALPWCSPALGPDKMGLEFLNWNVWEITVVILLPSETSQRWGAAKSGFLGALWKAGFAWMEKWKKHLWFRASLSSKFLGGGRKIPLCSAIPVLVGSGYLWDKSPVLLLGFIQVIQEKKNLLKLL